MALTLCPECEKKVSSEAAACPSCGHPLKKQPQQRLWSPGVAAVLSFLLPGLGQVYKGQILGGLVWLVFVIGGYLLFIIPGIVLHLVCVIAAAAFRRSL
jgi:TM2 domain-containing membrane protein YozV